MSKGAKFRQLIVHRIYQKTGKIFSTRELDSVFKDSILSDDILRFIEEDHEWFEAFENTVEYIDDIRNPFGILKHQNLQLHLQQVKQFLFLLCYQYIMLY